MTSTLFTCFLLYERGNSRNTLSNQNKCVNLQAHETDNDALLFGRWGVDVNNSSQQPTFVVDRLQDIIKIL